MDSPMEHPGETNLSIGLICYQKQASVVISGESTIISYYNRPSIHPKGALSGFSMD